MTDNVKRGLKKERKALCMWEPSSGKPFFSGVTAVAPTQDVSKQPSDS